MKIPRDVSGAKLSKLLKRFGFEITRQTGSHMRLTYEIDIYDKWGIPHNYS